MTPPTRHQVRRQVAIHWSAPDNIEHPDWVAYGLRIGNMTRVSNWWVGDWLRYGSARWGEKYGEAARITGLDAKTLRNLAYVASKFDLSRRRDTLTWSHHAELAALAPLEQDRWLDRSIEDRLSVADLRIELRNALRDTAATRTSLDNSTQLGGESRSPKLTILCPACGQAVAASDSEAADIQPKSTHQLSSCASGDLGPSGSSASHSLRRLKAVASGSLGGPLLHVLLVC